MFILLVLAENMAHNGMFDKPLLQGLLKQVLSWHTGLAMPALIRRKDSHAQQCMSRMYQRSASAAGCEHWRQLATVEHRHRTPELVRQLLVKAARSPKPRGINSDMGNDQAPGTDEPCCALGCSSENCIYESFPSEHTFDAGLGHS